MSMGVEQLLVSKGIEYKHAGRRVVIRCLNPEHEDNNPSLSIDSVTGLGKCFACGFSINLFTHFNQAYNYQTLHVHRLKKKITKTIAQSVGLELPDNYVPYKRSFRGVSGSVLSKFEAFTVDNDEWRDRIVFPLRDISGKTRGFIGRHMYSDAPPKYIMKPEGITPPLMPEKITPRQGSIIMVEGIFDFLNMYQHGMRNVCCAFGTQTLDSKVLESKIRLLKLQGVSKIYYMFDGDDSGRKAAAILADKTRSMEMDADTIDLDDDQDPGDLSAEDVKLLESMLYGTGGDS